MATTADNVAKPAAAKTRAPSLEELVASLEAKQLRTDLPEVSPGMTVVVHAKIVEKGKVRTQAFEGIIIKVERAKKLGLAIQVRRVASGVGVERTFFLHSPLIEKVEVKSRAKVRRAKLYYLRGLTGRAAQQKEEAPAKKASVKPKTIKSAPKAAKA
jgi:large subunit ribosomal protein L19